ncbi:GIN domain-containing protein [Tenuifilum thalassicum]|uniref:Putative auto-transporter adhesin head GIN domain-containing protein n=1 Tax=Tenuifilum thalassicum TaxID=2590900 RepID=A0A7D4BFB8_9BACT|nr:DUF2807 domain-containing protein [Tenuifilum thalassicum]QKG80558.1 hypothetical protein FHG85_09845 [Tenuifilum thalassicum]
MRNRSLAILLVLVLLSQSCEWLSDSIAGDVTTRKVNLLTHYDSFDIKGSFNVTLYPDTVGYALIRCPENVQPDVKLYFEDDKLLLRENVNGRWLKGYPVIDIEVHLSQIPTIDIRQPCKFRIPVKFKSSKFYFIDWGNYTDCYANVEVDYIRIDASGESFGKYIVEGSAVSCDLNVRGGAIFNLKNTTLRRCVVNHECVEDVYLNVENRLEANIYSSGNIILHGNPEVTLNRIGTGNVIFED